jgi:two-component system phosphate regulon sensor histidine kinase PhoR
MEGEIIGAVSIFHDIREIHLIDQAKSEFISFASHQLRTPLSIIGMNLELLIGHFDGTQTQDPEVVELVNEIVIAKERMNGLIDELLNVEQLELAAATSNAECFDARELIEQEMEDMQLLAQEKGISMKGIFQQQRIPFCFDRHHFRITVNNLLANAVKYSPEGKQVTIRARGNDETLVFSVKDKGFGIPKNQQDLIFGRLFRADNVRKMGIGGTGLGLYLVKRIVERQKGTIEVESEEGKGSVFTVTLPSVGENTVETGKNAS